MGIASILVVAVGLSMDAFAVAVAAGCAMGRPDARQAARIGAFFGGFQALMPVAGWLAGSALRDAIAAFDHWVAFGLLSAIGLKMIVDAARGDGEACRAGPMPLPVLLGLSVATSIDALAVGVGLSLLGVPIALPAAVIGAVTFVASFLGVYLGCGVGNVLRRGASALGGVALLAIGARILVEHVG